MRGGSSIDDAERRAFGQDQRLAAGVDDAIARFASRRINVDLGVTDKVRPLVAPVRAMVRDEIIPVEEE